MMMLFPREYLALVAPVPQRGGLLFYLFITTPPKFLLTLICSFLMFAIGKGKTYRIPWKIKGDDWSNLLHRQNLTWFRKLSMRETRSLGGTRGSAGQLGLPSLPSALGLPGALYSLFSYS